MGRRWPLPAAERTVPAGPRTSTTRRPARYRLKVRAVSSSIWAHAASEMGASSRCRLFMRNFSFEGTNAQRTVTWPRGGWRAIGRRAYDKRGSHRCGLVVAHGFQKCCGRSKKHVSRDGAAEIEQAVIVAGRPAHEHVFEHLFDGAGG